LIKTDIKQFSEKVFLVESLNHDLMHLKIQKARWCQIKSHERYSSLPLGPGVTQTPKPKRITGE